MEFAGDFETHLTVAPADANQLEQLRQWARRRELKFIHIVLDCGAHLSQPMLTTRGRGAFSDELAAAENLRDELSAAGLLVVRIKIEAAVYSEDVPQTAQDAAAASGYFEHHVKLQLDLNQDLTDLRCLAQQHSAHLSRNAFKQPRADGSEERFVTQRCYSTGLSEANKQFDCLLAALKSAEYPILKTEQEFVIYDDNQMIDRGWITT